MRTVRAVGVSEAYGVLTVGIAERADGTGSCLLFSAPSPDDPDRAFSCVDEHGRPPDGPVARIDIGPETLRVRFGAGAGAALGLEDDTTLHLALERAEVERLAAALREIAARCDDPPGIVVSL